MSLLEVKALTVTLGDDDVVHDVSFCVDAGTPLGLIGESGSGKSVTALAIMGLLPQEARCSGSVRLDGQELLGLPDRAMRAIRGQRVAMVFQEPMTALNPLQRVGEQIAEAVSVHGRLAASAAARRAEELIETVRLPDPAATARRYPHQLSGGQRQRVVLAIALSCDPDLLIADEPTTALDVTVQAEMLALLQRLSRERQMGLLLISHDLAVVASVCQDLLVMQAGAIVERGPVAAVFDSPAHPYTAALRAASRLELGDPARAEPAAFPVLEAVDVVQTYPMPRRSLFRSPPVVTALDGVSVRVSAGQSLGIVGESGSGKSTLVRALMALEKPTSGTTLYAGKTTSGRHPRELHALRREVGLVLQDPMSSLNPRMRIHDIVAEPLRSLSVDIDEDARVPELLDAVELPTDSAARFPHQFSGGQRQRIAIARALAARPRVLIADEPVSALDVSVRAQILDLLKELTEQFSLTLVLVSHDLSVVGNVCGHVVVMRRGRVVETGRTRAVYGEPQHPYTQRLLASVPTLDGSLLSRVDRDGPGLD